MLGADIGYRTNADTSFRGDRRSRLSLIKKFKNMVALTRSEWSHECLREDIEVGMLEILKQSIYIYFKQVT